MAVRPPQAFVIGWPISHSLSPSIHHFWLKENKLSGDYRAVAIAAEELPYFFSKLPSSGYCGGNVTIPHKVAARSLADICDEAATVIGAVNTLWVEKNKTYSTNSDYYGFLANLDEKLPDWAGDTALVFGAGGAARAVFYGLIKRAFDRIIVVNRTRGRAEQAIQSFSANFELIDFDAVNNFIGEADLIVNTTSLGMMSLTGDDYSSAIDFTKAKGTTIVTDIVYTPLMTPLLRRAKEHGLTIVDGLGMLLHQAVPGFERWFGVRPRVSDALRQAVLTKL